MRRQSIFNNLDPDRKDQFLMAFPENKKKKKQSPANALTAAIIKYVELCGACAARVNVMGIFDQSTGKYRTSGSKKGFEDVDVTYPLYIAGKKIGLKVAVEIKIGKDRQSEHQIMREQEVTKSGGVYIIAKTFDQFKQDFDEIKVRFSGLS